MYVPVPDRYQRNASISAAGNMELNRNSFNSVTPTTRSARFRDNSVIDTFASQL